MIGADVALQTGPVVQYTVNGLLFAGVLASGAVGFALIFGVLDIIDLSHGAQLILGAYLSYFISRAGLDPILTIPVVMAVLFALGYVYQRYLISRVMGGEPLEFLLVTFGVAMMARDLMNIAWTPTYRSISTPYASQSATVLGTVQIPYAGVLALLVAIILIGILVAVLYRAELGRDMRAVAENAEIAELTGINTEHTYALTFGIGAAFTGAAGTLLGITSTFSPVSESLWTLYAFVVLAIGGIGRPVAALLGGVVIGLVSSYTAYLINPAWSNVAVFAVLVFVLLVKPRGILGELGEGTA